MSENTNTNAQNTTTAAPRKKRAKKETFTVADLAAARAKKNGTDPFRAAKEVRGKLRANWSTVVKLDPSILKVKDAPNDGTRWPSVNAKVRDFILSGKKS